MSLMDYLTLNTTDNLITCDNNFFNTLLPIECDIIYTNTDRIGKLKIIGVFDKASSSEHFVLCCYAKYNNVDFEIVLKFHILGNKIVRFTQEHGQNLEKNYKKIIEQLNNFNKDIKTKNDYNIKINNIYILNTNKGHFWAEDYLVNFKKFWYTNGRKIDRLVGTDSTTLYKFQIYCEAKYGIDYVPIDLQGCEINNQRLIYLTDIEFICTLGLGWNKNDLIDAYNRFKLIGKYNYNNSLKNDILLPILVCVIGIVAITGLVLLKK